MALSDLEVFDTYAYAWRNEVLNEQIDLFNTATRGGITLGNETFRGDFSDKTFWKKKTTVRQRNAYSTSAISQVTMEQGLETHVKIDRGTPELIYYEADLKRLKENPKAEAIAFAEQNAKEVFYDMLYVGIGAYIAASAAQSDIYTDVGAADPSWSNLTALTSKMGDANARIVSWVMHSKSYFDLLDQNLANATALFTWDTTRVLADPAGRPIIVTDMPNLVVSGDYYILGLTEGGILVNQDAASWNANEERRNGKEQIETSYQAEWSYSLGLKGYTWDKTSGGRSPNNSALFTAANWDRTATDKKDLAGVLHRGT